MIKLGVCVLGTEKGGGGGRKEVKLMLKWCHVLSHLLLRVLRVPWHGGWKGCTLDEQYVKNSINTTVHEKCKDS